MRKVLIVIILVMVVVCGSIYPVAGSTNMDNDENGVIAFPGAEGFGKYSQGGRGGVIYKVTNLNDSGEGSLRAACEASGPRIVIFEVSGNIELEDYIRIRDDYITIAGQTAPGDGICLKNYGIRSYADHVTVRYIRSRPGDNEGEEVDAIWVAGGDQIIFDHCSTSWSVDEVFSVSPHTSQNGYPKRVTVQWCFITEPLESPVHGASYDHAFGTLAKGHYGAEYSFHHNLWAHCDRRSPALGSYNKIKDDCEGQLVDIRNNVIYNWGVYASYLNAENKDGVMKANFVNNYYKEGVDKVTNNIFVSRNDHPNARGYFFGNTYNNDSPITNQWTKIGNYHSNFRYDKPLYVTEVSTESAADAYQNVLNYAGASLVRDSRDIKVVNDVINGTGTILLDEPAWPVLNSTEPLLDTDDDGMPDSWEVSNGLDLSVNDSAGYDLDTQYTNIEVYINGLCPVQPITVDSSVPSSEKESRWLFENDYNDTVGSNNGMNYGDILFDDDSQEGSTSIELNGNNTYVEIPDSPLLDQTKNFTITAWIKPNTIGGLQGIFTKLKDNADKEYALSIEDGRITFDYEYEANNWNIKSSQNEVIVDQWQLITVTVDDSLGVKLYNGADLVAADTAPQQTMISTQPVNIGRWGGSYDSKYYNGLIDDIRFFNRVLSADEIAALAEEQGSSYDLAETFDEMPGGQQPVDWVCEERGNTIISVKDTPSEVNKSLCIEQPSTVTETVTASKSFAGIESGTMECKAMVQQTNSFAHPIRLRDNNGDIGISVRFSGNGEIAYKKGEQWIHTDIEYIGDKWYTFKVEFSTTSQTYDLFIDGMLIATDIEFESSITAINQLSVSIYKHSLGSIYVDDIVIYE